MGTIVIKPDREVDFYVGWYVGQYRHSDTITPDLADLGIIGFAALLILAGCAAGASVWGWLL